MAIPKETLWEIQPHTVAKHTILKRYLGAWFGIMGRSNQRIIYIDGFCGPGRYAGGEDGSPILAIKLATDHYLKKNVQNITFGFIDNNKERIEHLKRELLSLNIPNTFYVSVDHNEFDNSLTKILDDLEKRGSNLAPTFAFIDPFGFKGTPFILVERLLKNPKTEVFINFMVDSINRFLDHPNIQVQDHIVQLFGTPKVLQIINQAGYRIPQLKALYQTQLEKSAKFVRHFEMRDEDHRIIYYLFFASNNRLGHVKMKEAFWKVDPSSGCVFSDATDPNQIILFKEDPSKDVARILTTVFNGETVPVKIIQDYIEDKTAYLSSHMKKALQSLEEQGQIKVNALKSDGKKRIRKSFPEKVIVTFCKK